jgi:UDP-N-acetylmuramoyl-L-alanyl-D-glutamate--2,6-diaminopimelate ligase
MLQENIQRKEVLLLKLTDFIEYIKTKDLLNIINPEEIEIKGISYNSKTVLKGDIFICLVGEKSDGHNFAKMAEEKGAAAIISQKPVDVKIPVLIVEKTQIALSQASEVFYNFPSSKIRLIGVTGTNGKTTVTHLLQNIIEKAGQKCGLIGTLGYRYSSKEDYVSTNHTTPQAPELLKMLADMSSKNINYAVMEVSSHSLDQSRVGGCKYVSAILTNLTQDHLDYHITMDNYFDSKSKLFSSLSETEAENKYAVINLDDKYGEKFLKTVPTEIKTITYSINNKADVMAENIEFSASGSSFDCKTPFGNSKIKLQMAGNFSIYNALAALCAGLCENIPLPLCIEALEQTKSVSGRFETVLTKPLTIVDYAHTPDGLENVLNAAKKLVPQNGKLICLFGCGGDRDSTKRPKMGKIAEDLSDKIIITSDNPRTEDPQQIITDILSGIKSLNSDKIMVEPDRKLAIELAVKIATENDIIMIAGKGHEDYQILKDKTIHFDDREEALLAYEKNKKTAATV